MEHSSGREVTPGEQTLWRRFKAAQERSEYDRVSVAQVAEQETEMHPQHARQLARTWESEGLVEATGNGNYAVLTEYGQDVDEIV